MNRNKRSIALDLDDPEDNRLAAELARRADVLIDNFKPGTLERFGLGPGELRAANPRLVHCSITGFGAGAGAPRFPATTRWSRRSAASCRSPGPRTAIRRRSASRSST